MSATNIQWITIAVMGFGAIFAFFFLVFVFEATVHALRYRDQYAGGGGGFRMPSFGGRHSEGRSRSSSGRSERRRDPVLDKALAREAAKLVGGKRRSSRRHGRGSVERIDDEEYESRLERKLRLGSDFGRDEPAGDDQDGIDPEDEYVADAESAELASDVADENGVDIESGADVEGGFDSEPQPLTATRPEPQISLGLDPEFGNHLDILSKDYDAQMAKSADTDGEAEAEAELNEHAALDGALVEPELDLPVEEPAPAPDPEPEDEAPELLVLTPADEADEMAVEPEAALEAAPVAKTAEQTAAAPASSTYRRHAAEELDVREPTTTEVRAEPTKLAEAAPANVQVAATVEENTSDQSKGVSAGVVFAAPIAPIQVRVAPVETRAKTAEPKVSRIRLTPKAVEPEAPKPAAPEPSEPQAVTPVAAANPQPEPVVHTITPEKAPADDTATRPVPTPAAAPAAQEDSKDGFGGPLMADTARQLESLRDAERLGGSEISERSYPMYLRYRSSSGIVFDRIVQAVSLQDSAEGLTMRAYCHRSKAVRRIRVNNIVAAFDLRSRDVAVGSKVVPFLRNRIDLAEIGEDAGYSGHMMSPGTAAE